MERKLYFNGHILTMDKAHPRAEALLVEGGMIAAVGSFSELRALAQGAEKTDLLGKTVMPAFVDGHSHVMMLATMLHQCDLSECRSFDEILDAITEFKTKKGIKKGEKIRCYGYDLSLLKEGRHPTAEILDRLGGDNPIGCTHASFHMGVYNTVAMREAGIDDSFAPSGSGLVGRDESGHLNGYFEEGARRVMSSYMASGYTESFEENYLAAEKIYLENGITTIQDGGTSRRISSKNSSALLKAGK